MKKRSLLGSQPGGEWSYSRYSTKISKSSMTLIQKPFTVKKPSVIPQFLPLSPLLFTPTSRKSPGYLYPRTFLEPLISLNPSFSSSPSFPSRFFPPRNRTQAGDPFRSSLPAQHISQPPDSVSNPYFCDLPYLTITILGRSRYLFRGGWVDGEGERKKRGVGVE